MNRLPMPARRAVRSGRETSEYSRVLSAVVRLGLFHNERIELSRDEVEVELEVLWDFLQEVNDASPKV